MLSSHTLDIVIVTIVCITTVFGLLKGMVKQLLSVAGVIIGYVAAVTYYEQTAQFIPELAPGISKIASFAAIFLVCLILSSVLAWVVGLVFRKGGLSWFDRLGGGLFGLLKGLLIVMIITTILLTFLPPRSALLKNSLTLPYVITLSGIVSEIIPPEIKESYFRNIERLSVPRSKRDGSDGDEKKVLDNSR